jgi:hypothetical protein
MLNTTAQGFRISKPKDQGYFECLHRDQLVAIAVYMSKRGVTLEQNVATLQHEIENLNDVIFQLLKERTY